MSDEPEQAPPGWATATLGDVIDVLDSRRAPVNAEERAHRVGEIPYYGATGQVGWIDAHLFDEELVLLGEDGAPFLEPSKPKAYMIQGRSWVNNHAHVLRGRGLTNAFLMHQLNALDYHGFVTGTTRLKLPQGSMRSMPVVVPPSREQERIVAEIEKQFTRLDAGIEALKRLQIHLKRYRASVLKSACEGRLVPTEAELARREGRDYEPADKLLARILKERRSKWETDQLAKMKAAGKTPNEDSWKAKYEEPSADAGSLGPIAEGWVWANLAQLANLKGGITKGQKRSASVALRSVPYLRVANVQRGYLDLVEMKEISATEEEITDLRLVPGDILFNEGGDRDKLGRGWLWRGELPECIHQNHVFRARRFVSEIEPKFISWYGNSLGQRYFLDQGKQTTNLASINLTKLSALPVPLPPAAEQSRIVAEVEKYLSLLDATETLVRACLVRGTRLRQSILKHAFEGKLVTQDPKDESAVVLLERLRDGRHETEPSAGAPTRRARAMPALSDRPKREKR